MATLEFLAFGKNQMWQMNAHIKYILGSAPWVPTFFAWLQSTFHDCMVNYTFIVPCKGGLLWTKRLLCIPEGHDLHWLQAASEGNSHWNPGKWCHILMLLWFDGMRANTKYREGLLEDPWSWWRSTLIGDVSQVLSLTKIMLLVC